MQGLKPVEVIDLFPIVRQQGVALLSTLSDAQWQTPTVCPGWSVKDIALHLLGVNVANISRRRDGFGGNFVAFVPPGGDLDNQATLVASLGDWNEAWVIASRRLSPHLLCDLLTFTGEAIEAHYRTLDLTAMGGAVSWAGPDPAPVWLDVAREYTEQWTHLAQIRDALGMPILDEPHLFAPVLATFMHALPHTLRGVSRPVGTRLRVHITGPAGGDWVAVRKADRWTLVSDPDGRDDARLVLDQDTAWRLVTKGLRMEQARPRVQLQGDAELAAAALEMVSIIA